MNTLKNSAVGGHDMTIYVDGDHNNMRRRGLRRPFFQVLLSFIIIISVIYAPTYAASSYDGGESEQSESKQSANEPGNASAADKPENLTEYAAQKFDELKAEGIRGCIELGNS